MLDVSGNGHHGQVIGAQLIRGQIGDAMLFDGKDDSIVIKSLISAMTKQSKQVAVVMWLKPTALRSKEAGYAFTIGSNGGRAIWVAVDSGDWLFGMPTDWGGTLLRVGTPKVNTWQHVACVWDGEKQRVFVDGQLAGEKVIRSFDLRETTLGIHPTDKNADAKVARLGTQAKAFKRSLRYYSGAIDEFAIFTRALSADEVKQLYELGKRGISFGGR